VLGRNRGVSLDHGGHHATERLDAKCEWRHIKQEHIFTITRQHRTLDRSTDSNRFVGIDIATGITAKEFLDLFLHLGHPSHTAHENHIVNVCGLQACVFQSLAAGLNRAFDQLIDQGFKLRPRDFQVQMLGSACICGDVGQIQLGLLA